MSNMVIRQYILLASIFLVSLCHLSHGDVKEEKFPFKYAMIHTELLKENSSVPVGQSIMQIQPTKTSSTSETKNQPRKKKIKNPRIYEDEPGFVLSADSASRTVSKGRRRPSRKAWRRPSSSSLVEVSSSSVRSSSRLSSRGSSLNNGESSFRRETPSSKLRMKTAATQSDGVILTTHPNVKPFSKRMYSQSGEGPFQEQISLDDSNIFEGLVQDSFAPARKRLEKIKRKSGSESTSGARYKNPGPPYMQGPSTIINAGDALAHPINYKPETLATGNAKQESFEENYTSGTPVYIHNPYSLPEIESYLLQRGHSLDLEARSNPTSYVGFGHNRLNEGLASGSPHHGPPYETLHKPQPKVVTVTHTKVKKVWQ